MQIVTTTLENSSSVHNGVELIYILQPTNFTLRWHALEKLLHMFIKETHTGLLVAKKTGNNPNIHKLNRQLNSSIFLQWISLQQWKWNKDESPKHNGEGNKQVTEGSKHSDSIVIKLKTGKVNIYIHGYIYTHTHICDKCKEEQKKD